MLDYKQMYLSLFSAVEDAISDLIAAQRKCEDPYVDTSKTTDNTQADETEALK